MSLFSYFGLIVTSDNEINETIQCEKRTGWDEESLTVKIVLISISCIIFITIIALIICCICNGVKSASSPKRLPVTAVMGMQMYNNDMMANQMYSQSIYAQGNVNVHVTYGQGYPQYYQNYNVNGFANGNAYNNESGNIIQQLGEKNLNENTPIINGAKNS